MPALPGALELHGLISEFVPRVMRGGPDAGRAFRNITRAGREFLDRLADDQN